MHKKTLKNILILENDVRINEWWCIVFKSNCNYTLGQKMSIFREKFFCKKIRKNISLQTKIIATSIIISGLKSSSNCKFHWSTGSPFWNICFSKKYFKNMDYNTLYRAVALSDNTAAIIYQWSSGNRALIMSSNEKVVSM